VGRRRRGNGKAGRESLLFSCFITPLPAYWPLRPPCPAALPLSLSPPRPLPPPPAFSTPPTPPTLPLHRPLRPLLEHPRTQNAGLARPTTPVLCLSHLPHSAVSLFLCLVLLLSIRTTLPVYEQSLRFLPSRAPSPPQHLSFFLVSLTEPPADTSVQGSPLDCLT
jgi:hypothetical protein